jgi:citrate lyase beta subunit
VTLRRSTLFVGALVLDGLDAALASGADVVCIDLEDAVPPARKDEGRAATVERMAGVRSVPGIAIAARINAAGEFDGPVDLRTLATEAGAIATFILPKVAGPDEVRWAGAALEELGSEAELAAIIETTAGLEAAAAIARAHPRLKSLYFGGFDLSTALGCDMAWEPLLYARSRTVHAAAGAGIECLDSPFPDVNDADGLAQSCARVKALGMTGKCAKHASQVAGINAAFTPSAGELDRALRIVAAFEADPTRPLVFDGKLVELPTVKRLQRLVRDHGS